MTDKSAAASDRTSEQQGQKGLNVVSAGLNPCSQSFNDDYRSMLKLQLSKATGQDLRPDMLDKVEERLNKNGYKMEDIAGNPDNYQSAISQAYKQEKDSLDELAVKEMTG
jgi:hypothetical protein